MQVVLKTKTKEPSAELRDKIRSCVSIFRSLGDTVTEIIDMGKEEGFTLAEISRLVREELAKAKIPERSIRRYLPSELKRSYIKQTNNSAKMAVLVPQSKSKVLTFQASVTVNRDKRKISILAQYRDDVDHYFVGRKVNVKIW